MSEGKLEVVKEGKIVGIICKMCGEVMTVAASEDKGDYMEILMGCSACGDQYYIKGE